MLSTQKNYSQTKIEGISIFKIDKTKITIIDSLVTTGYSLKICSDLYSCSQYKVSGMNIYEMKNDTIKPDRTLPLMKGNRKFVIGEYVIAGIKIKNLELNFNDDVLFEIKSSGDLELQSALKTKYNGEVTANKKEISCKSVYGEFKEEEVTYKTNYRTDEKIIAYSILRIYFDSKCKKQTMNYTIINNPKITGIVDAKNRELYKIIDDKKQLLKKAELNKL